MGYNAGSSATSYETLMLALTGFSFHLHTNCRKDLSDCVLYQVAHCPLLR